MTRRCAYGGDGRLLTPPGVDIPHLLRPDGSEQRRRLRAGEISCVELAVACLDQIRRLNPTFNAVVSLRPREEVLADAEAADTALRHHDPVGPLHGLPLAIKDLAATAGLRTTLGSPLFADHVPGMDDLMVARLRAAGAIIVGKTNTPEMGLGSHTYNPVFGATGNVFDPTLSAGGSSGGAAVALALRLLPVADGSDMGGSLRNPGAWNNVLGFRPSQGRVPNVPAVDPFYTQLSTNGPMGVSAADLGLLLDVMAGPHPAAPLALPPEPGGFASVVPAAGRPRIAWLGDLGGHLPFESGVLDLCRAALAELEAAGWTVENVTPRFDWPALWRAFVVLRQFSMVGRWGAVFADPARGGRMKPEMRWEIEGGLGLTGSDLAAAALTRGAWFEAACALLAEYDALALPTAQLFPFPVKWPWPGSVGGRSMDSYHRWMEVVIPGTMSGCPVANVPAGFGEAGLPMGLQLIGRPRGDRELLALVSRFERDAQSAAA